MCLKILMFLVVWALCLVPAHADIHLVFGVYASDKPLTMVKKFRHTLTVLEDSLTEKLGEPVSIKIHVAKDYEQGIVDLVDGEVDFSRFGSASYVNAKARNPDIGILAMETKKGKKFFSSMMVVHGESDIRSVQDIKGKRIAFGNKNSSGGRYFAQQFLINNNVFGSDLKDYDYLGRHDAVGEAVGVKAYDAGFLKEGTYKKMIENGNDIRVVARYDVVTKPWIHAAHLDPKIVEALSVSLLEIDDPKIIKKGRFVKGMDQDFSATRQAIRSSRAFYKK